MQRKPDLLQPFSCWDSSVGHLISVAPNHLATRMAGLGTENWIRRHLTFDPVIPHTFCSTNISRGVAAFHRLSLEVKIT